MYVLLINPWIYDFAAYDFWLKPLGLLYVGAALKKLGFEVQLIDLLNRHDPELANFVKPKPDKKFGTGKFHSFQVEKNDLLRNIPRRYKCYGAPVEYLLSKLSKVGKPRAVFVTSSLTYWWPGVAHTISYVKQVMPDVPVVLGGLYARLYPEHAKKNTKADYVFSDELSKIGDLINSVLCETVNFDAENWFEILDPAYELYEKVGYLVFLTSLGCPYRCTYCISPKLWKRFIQKDPQKVLEAIEKFLDLFKVKDVVFFDDAILINRESHFKPLLRLLIKKNFGVNYHLPNGIHARLVDEELAILMREAGFKTIKLGYETAGKLQELTGGKVYDQDLVKAARILTKAGFTDQEVQAYIMINMPFQGIEDVLKAIEVCKNEGISVSVNEYTPIPGSQDWYVLVSNGFLDEHIDPVLLNNTVLPYWFKAGMNAETVQMIKNLVHRK
ncbi:B12-binding domain-containing radical SAM protein [Thermotoga profunda]|uniref:B12-binding domain-containing radical SAM protein n=1 Tax=Thermotoga profunda TaxID=1508420 RepID=UPI000597155A|nr:radical SAM protein [Thermotoga profunda]